MARTLLRCTICLCCLAVAGCVDATPGPQPATTLRVNNPANPTVNFQVWLEDFRRDARAQGISERTLAAALGHLQPSERVIELSLHQPEFTRAIWDYLDSAASMRRIEIGRRLRVEYDDLLRRIEQRYGVPPAIVLAIWGLETDFGRVFGDFEVVRALATLAHQGRRRDFGREQLLAALQMIDRGDIDAARMIGSWAGAMGHTQFIPTTYMQYAVDFDGDGQRNLWRSVPDALASTANYLARSGWQRGETWGYEVRLATDFDWSQADPQTARSAAQWQRLGVRQIDGSVLPEQPQPLRLLAPAGHHGPVLLTGDNFRAILRYNNATSYALGVGLLARGIEGQSGLRTDWPRHMQPLNRRERTELQRLLTEAGFDTGGVDGIVGPLTRAAIRRYQNSQNQIEDGFPTRNLLSQLRQRRAY